MICLGKKSHQVWRKIEIGQYGACFLIPLAEAPTVKIIQGITYNSESVRIDGKHFKDCTFSDCSLEYSGGSVVLERVSIVGCHHVLYGYARQTAQYMRTVGLIDEPVDSWTEYPARVN